MPTLFFAASIGILSLIAVCLVVETFLTQFGLHLSVITWIAFVSARPFLAGAAAGIVVSAVVYVLALKTVGDMSQLRGLIISLVPVTATALLYLIGVQGAPQRIGLTEVKAGGVELTFESRSRSSLALAAATTGAHPAGTSPVFAGADDDPFKFAYFMTHADTGSPDFGEMSFFEQEEKFLAYFGIDVIAGQDISDPLVDPIKLQRNLLMALNPLVGCVRYDYAAYADRTELDRLAAPTIEALATLDAALRHLAVKTDKDTIDVLQHWHSEVLKRAGDLWKQFSSLPEPDQLWLELPRDDGRRSMWSDCRKSIPRDVRPNVTVGQAPWHLSPPYITMFIVSLRSALGMYGAGLRMINAWLADTPEDGEGGKARDWLLDRARRYYIYVLTDASQPFFPSGSAARDALRKTVMSIEKHWSIDPGLEGSPCGSDRSAPATNQMVGSSPEGYRKIVRDRLVTIQSSLTQLYLHLLVDSRSPALEDHLDLVDHRMARTLIASAGRCLNAEDQSGRNIRRALDLFEGGRTLARLAIDGPATGLLIPGDVEEVRKTAHAALMESLPLIRNLEREEARQHEREEARQHAAQRALPLGIGLWEPYRRIAEEEALELAALLSSL
jgi:hypothetical protein